MKVLVDEGKKKVTLRLTKVDDFDNSALEKAFPFYKCKPRLDDIDVELHPLISEMWARNYRTFNCCSGHGKVQGYITFLPPGKRRLRTAIWDPKAPIPKHITELSGILKSTIILAKGEDFQPFVDKIKQYSGGLDERKN